MGLKLCLKAFPDSEGLLYLSSTLSVEVGSVSHKGKVTCRVEEIKH